MSSHRLLERFFYEARRNAFLVSFFYFIGAVAGLGALTMLDPELGVVIPILGGVWTVALTAVFLLLIHRMHQPLAQIIEVTNEFFAGIMRDEELEPVGAGPEAEKRLLEVTQEVEEMKKEISRLREGGSVPSVVPSQYSSIDWFWPILILEWAAAIILVLLLTFMIPDVFNVYFAVAGVVGLTIIALSHAHIKNRLKWPRRLKWLGGDE